MTLPQRKTKLIRSRSFAAAVLAGCTLALPQNGEAQSPVTYTGEATAVSVSVLGLIHTSISDTGPLPASGGSLSRSLLTFQLPGILDLSLLTASTAGANNQTTSRASVANVELTVAGVYATAEVLTSNATAACDPGSATASGTSTIAGLKVNGLSVTVTGAPNQTIPLIVGSLVINEQISSVNISPIASSGSMLVNALHLKVNGIADVTISSSEAGVACSAPTIAPE